MIYVYEQVFVGHPVPGRRRDRLLNRSALRGMAEHSDHNTSGAGHGARAHGRAGPLYLKRPQVLMGKHSLTNIIVNGLRPWRECACSDSGNGRQGF